ncbi:MAG: alpha/beta fold hydrolase [Pseudomonadota bacterium]
MKALITHLILLAVMLSPRVGAFEIEPASCVDFINQTDINVSCKFVSLPLNHLKPDERIVKLPLLVAHSPRLALSREKRAILIPGAGGPGASMGFGYQYRRGEFLQPYNSLLDAGYDLVILDQRGAGLSSPRLTCFESIEVFEQLITHHHNINQEIAQYQQAAKQCKDRLHAHGVELFDTQQSANDFLAVMATLDYDWWGTIATSYATVIAQTMLVINPDAFDRVVLDSPVPLDYQRPLTTESAFQSIEKSIGRCLQMANCHHAYPDLLASFKRVVARARRSAYELKLTVFNRHNNRTTLTLIIDQSTLLSILANAIYSNDGIATLPRVINAMDRGDTRALQYYAEEFWYQSIDDTYADALNLTVHCKERQSLEKNYIKSNPGYLNSLSADTQKLLSAQTELCANWGVKGSSQPAPGKPISVPTLVLSGSLDPVISAADIRHTTNDFSSAIAVAQVSGAGHAVWYQSECVRLATTEFFEGKSLERLSQCALEVPAFK